MSCQREGWLWGGLEVWSKKGKPHHYSLEVAEGRAQVPFTTGV